MQSPTLFARPTPPCSPEVHRTYISSHRNVLCEPRNPTHKRTQLSHFTPLVKMRPTLKESTSSDSLCSVASFNAADYGNHLGYAGPELASLPDPRAPLKAYMRATRHGVSEDELPEVPFLKAVPPNSTASTVFFACARVESTISERPAVLVASSGRVGKTKKLQSTLPEHLTPSNKNYLDSHRYKPKPTSDRPTGFESFPPPQLPVSPVTEMFDEEQNEVSTRPSVKPSSDSGLVRTLRLLFE